MANSQMVNSQAANSQVANSQMVSSMQPAHHRSGAGRESPRLYRSVFDLLKRKIDTAELPHGCRVREGQIASILDVSRGPVRHAIGLLLKEGALRETDGQKVVAGAPAHHTAMTTQELRRIIIDDSARDITRKNAWENIFAEARHQIISCLPFGTYRVMEAGLARHYNVSRTVAREVLARLSDVRLIEKNRRSHWIAGPLTARDLAETMSMRILLEPHALALAARDIDAGLVTGMKRRVLDVLNSSGPHDRERFCMLENDLHHILLQKCGKPASCDCS